MAAAFPCLADAVIDATDPMLTPGIVGISDAVTVVIPLGTFTHPTDEGNCNIDLPRDLWTNYERTDSPFVLNNILKCLKTGVL